MLKIGLTGGIGSGKSTVAKVFEVLGIPVYYADDAARRLMNEDEMLKAKIIEHFGENAYVNGALNRGYISSLVFKDKKKLALLNSLSHPVVMHDSEEWMRKQHAPYAIREAALIFESDIHRYLDFVIGVSAPEQLRIERTMKRDGIAEEEVLKRMANQMDEEEKMKRSDFVIINDERQLMVPQVLQLHGKFLQMNN
ncbi:MAG: dephospho-CoA kinase [Bacteroidetes bacterium]|nr:dephospho-CoA kinase [Bacteroidota bacterium]MBS1973878.1 dephospho-CoA kinase [Bacteroidota bacterium]